MHWLFVGVHSALFPLRIADNKLSLCLAPFISIAALILLITLFATLSRKRLHKKLSKYNKGD